MAYPCDRSFAIKGLESITICRQFPATCQQPSLPLHPGVAPKSPKTSPAKETGEGLGLGDGLGDRLGDGLGLGLGDGLGLGEKVGVGEGDADGDGLGEGEVLVLGMVITGSGRAAILGDTAGAAKAGEGDATG